MVFPEIYDDVGVFACINSTAETGLSEIIYRQRIATGQTGIEDSEQSITFTSALIHDALIWNYPRSELLNCSDFDRSERLLTKILHSTIISDKKSAVPLFFHGLKTPNEENLPDFGFAALSFEERETKILQFCDKTLGFCHHLTFFYFGTDKFVTYTFRRDDFLSHVRASADEAKIPLHIVKEENELPIW